MASSSSKRRPGKEPMVTEPPSYDTRKFRSQFHEGRYHRFMKTKNVIYEKGLELKDGEYTIMRQITKERRWELLCAPLVDISAVMIREFYANAVKENKDSAPYTSYFDVSSSENMGDTGLPPVPIPNESTSIRSSTALPPVPAPQRNTRKLASRGRGKRQAVEEAPVDDSAETETDEGKRKPSRPRSWTWDHFTKDETSNPQYPRAKCNWCGASYGCDTHKNGTSNMKNHLLSQCKKFSKEALDPTQKILCFQDVVKDDRKGIGSSLSTVSFDVDRCRQALARMIIVDELPFSHVEGEGFRYYTSCLQPKFPIPGRLTVARDCWKLYLNEKIKLKSVFSQPNQNICLTTDCWSSVQNLNYLCLTAHYIDANWKLQKRIMNFCAIKNHKGETIRRKIERCLLSWGISRVFSITVDNASSNDVALSYLKNRMEDWNSHLLRGEFLHVRCCAHILNLVVNDGLREMHESILKIRNAVRHVRASPGRTERWNSAFLMLESALKFQKAFKRLGERDFEFAMMAGGIPRSEDWENTRHFVKFLKIFYEVTNKVSGSTFVTSSQHFNDFCKILSTLKNWMGSLDTVLSSMTEKMKSKYDKYWGNIKNTNMMIFIAVVLDPRYKLQLIKWSFEKLYETEDAEFLTSKVKETLFKVFDSYRLFGGNYQRSTRQDPPEISTQELEAHETSFAMEFEKEMQFNKSVNKNEVELYLMEALEKSGVQFDILNWWKVNSTKFPILGGIARDVLASFHSCFRIGI
ncbi:zinc finger BED domain-containing protein RICESLEEPER 2-like [Arachis hypogaea]|uniref:zinc finger BED domain-containing protein RICESLEEPER 2-like n=1 Tax=Arachis hypogaea TaxID=3818 RepID=UPI003B21B34A